MKPKLSDQILLAHQIAVAQEAGTPLNWEYKVPDGKINMLMDQMNPAFCLMHGYEISIKPWVLGDSVNGHTLGEGQRWHREDFTREMLPEGYRPAILGEVSDDMQSLPDGPGSKLGWVPAYWRDPQGVTAHAFHHRTKRPLPPVPAPPKMVPLEVGDVPPGSIFRKEDWRAGDWLSALAIRGGNIETTARTLYLHKLEEQGWLISRDNGKTWNPCSKPEV